MRARLLGAALCWYALSAHAELGINVYGLSYHLDQDKAKELGVDNQVNPGLGVRGGALWHATERVRLGGALALLNSKTYNGGKSFIAPLPVAAYEWGRVTLNAVYMPKVHEVNDINTFGFWLTVWLR